MVGARDCRGWRGMGSHCSVGTGFQFHMVKGSWRWMVAMNGAVYAATSAVFVTVA